MYCLRILQGFPKYSTKLLNHRESIEDIVDCKTCGEKMLPRTIVWRDPDRPPVQHTNFVCEKCGASIYKRYVLTKIT